MCWLSVVCLSWRRPAGRPKDSGEFLASWAHPTDNGCLRPTHPHLGVALDRCKGHTGVVLQSVSRLAWHGRRSGRSQCQVEAPHPSLRLLGIRCVTVEVKWQKFVMGASARSDCARAQICVPPFLLRAAPAFVLGGRARARSFGDSLAEWSKALLGGARPGGGVGSNTTAVGVSR